MAEAAAAAPGLRVGRVLNLAFHILLRGAPKYIALMAVVWLPQLLYSLFAAAAVVRWGGQSAQQVIDGFLLLALNSLSDAVVLYGAFQDMRARPFGFGQSLAKGLARFLPVLGLSIAVGLGELFGLVLLIVPGLIFMTMWSVAPPACVVEGRGPFDALRRSAFLTEGYRWKVFAIVLLIGVVTAIVSGVAEVIFAQVGDRAATIADFVVNVVIGAWQSVVVAVLYHDLRVAKEGIDIDGIAAVFD